MALKPIRIQINPIIDLAREIKIRFPDANLKILKEKRKIIIKSKTKLNFFEMKEIELVVKQYHPNHEINFYSSAHI